jgi:hypothetical protein
VEISCREARRTAANSGDEAEIGTFSRCGLDRDAIVLDRPVALVGRICWG